MSDEFVEEIPEGLQDLVTHLNQYARTQSQRLTEWPEVDFPSLEPKDFRLLRVLGRGGMGTVYVAEQLSLERQVAVKVLARELVKNDQDRLQFERESKLIAMLHHPGIVKVLSAGECNGRYFYAMELVDGTTLDKVAFKDLRHLAMTCVKVANALAYAHQCGVLHRDIKPANVFVDQSGDVHVGDFGIAYALGGGQQMIEAKENVSGTPAYLAPERRERGENTVQSDIYSFGILLRELIRTSGFKAPKALNAILQHCIEKEPKQRYAQISDVADDLMRWIRCRPVMAARPTIVTRMGLWIRRNPIYGVLIILALMGLAMVGVSSSIATAQRLHARHLLEACTLPSQPHTTREEQIQFARVLDLAERTLGRYPDDGPIVEKALEFYDEYMRLQTQHRRNGPAFREMERIVSKFEVLFWNPNISDSVKERLIELQLYRYEMLSHWGEQAEKDYLREKIALELTHYEGAKAREFLTRLEALPRIIEKPATVGPSARRHEVRYPMRRYNSKRPYQRER